MAGAGSVSWMFAKKGYIAVSKNSVKEDDLMDIVLEAGAEDVKSEDKNNFEIYTQMQGLEKVKTALQEKNIPWETAELIMEPSSKVKVVGNDAKGILNLVEALEEHEDVQDVYENSDIPEDVLEQLAHEE